MRPWATFLGAPVVWFAHFMVVYLALEAGCAADGSGFRFAGVPALSGFTVAATAAAAAGTLFFAHRGYRLWRSDGEGDGLAFAGFLLGLLFFVAVLFVGLPALWLDAC